MTDDEFKIWTEINNTFEVLNQTRVSYGEDNTFSLPYYATVQKGYHKVTEQWHDMVQWCHKRFGPHWDIDNIRGVWCYDSVGTFNFKTERDRTMFMLRWAQ